MKAFLRILTLLSVAVFILAPIAQVVILSFVVTLPHPGYTVGAFSLINYRHIFDDPRLVASLGNSLIYVVANVALTLMVSLPAAYAISRFRFVGDRHLMLLLLSFRIMPPVVLSLPVFLLFAQINLLNTPLAIALAHCLFNIPVAIWILESFISAVPRAFDENAFLDGYGLRGFILRHLLPMIAPGIGVAAFFCFIFSWVEVVFARILTSTGGKPVTMAIEGLFGFRTDVGLVMAMTVFSLIPGLVLIAFVRNHIARGFRIRV